MPVPIEEMARQQFPQLPLEFLYYNEVEYRFFKAIGWSYTYCWKSWTDAIAACETRYALIHDMDAFLLRPDVFEERYRFIRAGRHQYVGVNVYHFNGIEREDNLVTTWELMFDVAFVREQFRPLDLFNHVCMYKGRAVEFDCFLYAQSQRGSNVVLPIRKSDMVHPTQTITQYTDLINVKGYVPPAANNLLMIPYFYYLADRPTEMTDLTAQLTSSPGPVYRLFDHPMDLRRLSCEHAGWITTQAYTLERAAYGEIREPVRRYFEAIQAFADAHDAAPASAPAPAPASVATADRVALPAGTRLLLFVVFLLSLFGGRAALAHVTSGLQRATTPAARWRAETRRVGRRQNRPRRTKPTYGTSETSSSEWVLRTSKPPETCCSNA
jgi:hypothetical protein